MASAFCESRESVENDPCSGEPVSTLIKMWRKCANVMQDIEIIIWPLTECLGLGKEAARQILEREQFCNDSQLQMHDNVPAYCTLKLKQFLASNRFVCDPVSPLLDRFGIDRIFFFLKVKLALKGGYFSNISDIQQRDQATERSFNAGLLTWIPAFVLTISAFCEVGRRTHLSFHNQCSLIMYQVHYIKHQNLWMHPHNVWVKLHNRAAYFLTWNL
jgi:hypothetical protein